MTKDTDIGIHILNALDDGNLGKIEELLSGSERCISEVTPKESWNWLHKALMGFDSDVPPRKSIEFLISHGVPVNAQDCYGMTPLHYAMRGKNAEAAIALLEAGANPNIPNCENVIPLRMTLLMPNRLDVLELMLENGGNVNYYNGKDYLLERVKEFRGNHPDFKELIDMMDKYSKNQN